MNDLFDDQLSRNPGVLKRAGRSGMGAHQSAAAGTTTWLTPPHIIEALGGADSFDLDPCAFPGWITARRHICLPDDGLAADWGGPRARVFLNPPYSTVEVERWLRRLGDHGTGQALIFARTDTAWWTSQVRDRASGLLFLEGRLHFHYPDGTRAAANSGAPSVLCAYGPEELERLASCDLPGMLTPLRFPRFVLVEAAPATWREAVLAFVRDRRGPVSVSDLYRALAKHPKTAANPHWRAKVRQTLQRGPFEALGGGVWAEAAG